MVDFVSLGEVYHRGIIYGPVAQLVPVVVANTHRFDLQTYSRPTLSTNYIL